MSPAPNPTLPVLVIGAGPVGLFQAYSLVKLGVPVIIVERHKTRLGAPKAHALSPRSLEICRQFGISISAIREKPAPRDEARWVRFVTNLSGEEVGCLPYERMSIDVLDASPEMLHNIAQPDFEDMLATLLSKEKDVQILKGWTWSRSQETASGVITTLKATYGDEELKVKSRFIIACDGANSRIRKSLGITTDSEDGSETMMTIHFKADLRPIVKERVGMLHWIMDPAARGFIIAYDLGGNQVLIHNFDPNNSPLESFTEDKCRQVVSKAIGQTVPLKILSSLPWILRHQVAHQYFRGSVILAGDSAHSFPPTGGLGLNSGIADAHNLAYKIRDIYRCDADPEIVLKLYETERRPVAMRNAIQSVKNGKKVFSLLRALKNTNPDVEVATREMYEALSDPQQRALITQLIEEQREHFDNLMLHIGYVYEPNWNPSNATDYVPAYRMGARLPHVWIQGTVTLVGSTPVDLSYLKSELDEPDMAKRRYSTLDLVDKGSMTIICSDDQGDLANALVAGLSARGIPARTARTPADFQFEFKEAGDLWIHELGLDSGGLIVVRPDQHIQMLIRPETSMPTILKSVLEGVGIGG